ncbi:BLUF domain-containing protein [Hymenobacter cellulosilyticus]|uniref:BLUF domain-containing protein n=1 Tax=Hymenobacter cellulosilyticus TaxID=2932248 RepID=A0A8T9QEW7_9BACT|nr:BLUF domain-containing protein [Hymenobacter cellulosilyticus]UOQ74109.1 BLUF domain-containing protein [Hymenobacter cellulosilyticus]
MLYTEAQRQRAVAWAVSMTTNTSLAPRRYERHLLENYQRGHLTLDEVLHLLDTSIYQLLYRSQAVGPMAEQHLQQLLEWSRAYNAQHRITGLLLYSEGHFVQVLEGPQEEVRTLYARIQQDVRHQRIVTIGEGPEPVRRFADWSMGFGHVAATDIDVVLQATPIPFPSPDVQEEHIQALLQAFGVPLYSIPSTDSGAAIPAAPLSSDAP